MHSHYNILSRNVVAYCTVVKPAITFYQDILEGSPSDVEADFELWNSKYVNGTISTDIAFDAFECCPQTYPNIKFLLQILTTLPVTTASVEISFPMLRKLKIWLRSSLYEDRLTGLALLTSATDIELTPKLLKGFLSAVGAEFNKQCTCFVGCI